MVSLVYLCMQVAAAVNQLCQDCSQCHHKRALSLAYQLSSIAITILPMVMLNNQSTLHGMEFLLEHPECKRKVPFRNLLGMQLVSTSAASWQKEIPAKSQIWKATPNPMNNE